MNPRLSTLIAAVGLAFGLATASGQTWDLANDFSATNNPNGAWAYGEYGFTLAGGHYYDASVGFDWWTTSGSQTTSEVIGLNGSGVEEFGIPPQTVSLECDYYSPDARWTAPAPGLYNIQIQIGGSTAADSAGSGNANVANAGVAINTTVQSPNGFVNNIKTWTFANLSLNAGDTVDAFVGQQFGSGNTATIFTVTAVPLPPPPSTNYYVDWLTVAGGGGTSTGGIYTVSGTFGQADAGGPMQGGGFSVSGGFWSLYAAQTASVNGSAPTIVIAPKSQFVSSGNPVAFSVSVSGTPPLFYQWQKNGVNLTDGGNLSGSLTTNLALSATSTNDAGGYAIVIDNAFGSITSSVARLTLILPAYYLTDLTDLGASGAIGINNHGQAVVGTSIGHAALYSGGRMTDLGTLGGNLSIGAGINNNGQVVGYSLTAGGYDHAFLYSAGTMSDLGTFNGPANESFASGINDSGQIVGYAQTANGYGWFLCYNGTMENLSIQGGALGINNNGQIVGSHVTNSLGLYDAYLYAPPGSSTDLGTLGGSYSEAAAINTNEQIVGYAFTSAGYIHAVSFSGLGTDNDDLGTLGGLESYARAINNAGQIVGWSYLPNGGQHAFFYANGIMYDLNDMATIPGDYLVAANGINDSGQIIADSDNGHVYILTPSLPNSYLGGPFPPVLQLQGSPAASSFSLVFQSSLTYPPVDYELQTTTNLINGPWVNTGTFSGNMQYSIALSASGSQRFYRVLMVQ